MAKTTVDDYDARLQEIETEMRELGRINVGVSNKLKAWVFGAALGTLGGAILLLVACQAQAQQGWGITPPPAAIITDNRGQIWIVTEGPRSPGSPLSSFHVQRGAGTVEPLPPIITPRAYQPLGSGHYQPNFGHVPQYNPLTGRVE